MPYDAYAKFGDDPAGIDDDPAIPGDSDDTDHYWWCELRGCGLDLTVQDIGTSQDSDSGEDKKNNPSFGHVTLKKRIDWASILLIKMCCKTGGGKIEKTADENTEINAITVHVCRTINARNLPYIILIYKKVRILSYAIEMSGPEPSETIEFEFKSLDFEYLPTSPYTGLETGERFSVRNLQDHSDLLGRGNRDLVPGGPGHWPSPVLFPGLHREHGFGILPH